MLENATSVINIADVHHGPPPDSVIAAIVISIWLITLFVMLIIELPVFFVLGFRKIKTLAWATLIVSICVLAYQWISYSLDGELNSGAGFIIAQVVITVAEATLLALILKKHLSRKKIIIATICANAVFAIIKLFC